MTQDRASGCVCASLSLVGQPTPIRPSTAEDLGVLDEPWHDYVVYKLGAMQVLLLLVMTVLVVSLRRRVRDHGGIGSNQK